MMRKPITSPMVIGDQPATEYVIDRIIIDYNKGEFLVDLRHVSAEDTTLLRQVVREPISPGVVTALENYLIGKLKDLGVVN